MGSVVKALEITHAGDAPGLSLVEAALQQASGAWTRHFDQFRQMLCDLSVNFVQQVIVVQTTFNGPNAITIATGIGLLR